MSDSTAIKWTDSTWNPVRGCSRVSEGCRNCYAEGVAHRFSGPGQAYEGLVRIGADGERRREWNGQIRFVEEHLLDPLRWGPVRRACANCLTFGWPEGYRLQRCDPKLLSCTGPTKRGRRIFVNSMSDLFHENVTDAMRDLIFAVMALCPQHTFQVLTKRPERMLAYLDSARERIGELAFVNALRGRGIVDPEAIRYAEYRQWPLPNVWLGVSVERQQEADARIPLLLQTPAAVRFVSAEPLLGPVDLTDINRDPSDFDRTMPGFAGVKRFSADALDGRNCVVMPDVEYCEERGTRAKLDWVICGGESGAGARPMHPDWARSLRDQCRAAGVPFFFKQWGEWLPYNQREAAQIRDSVRFAYGDFAWRVGKKAAGHLLDGREWHQFPEVRA